MEVNKSCCMNTFILTTSYFFYIDPVLFKDDYLSVLATKANINSFAIHLTQNILTMNMQRFQTNGADFDEMRYDVAFHLGLCTICFFINNLQEKNYHI